MVVLTTSIYFYVLLPSAMQVLSETVKYRLGIGTFTSVLALSFISRWSVSVRSNL